MAGNYYEIVDDLDYPSGSRRIAFSRNPELMQGIELPDRWYLGPPASTDPHESFYGEEFAMGIHQTVAGRLTVNVDYDGIPLDFTFAALGMPVVNSNTANVFRQLAPNDMQLIPIIVEGRLEEYFIANALRSVDCIDYQRTEVQFWENAPETPPEKVGKPEMIVGLHIKESSIPRDIEVFRLQDWIPPLIVSERIKKALEVRRTTGIKFAKVT